MRRNNGSTMGHVLAQLAGPMFVLNMGRSKVWSDKALHKHLRELRDGCAKAIEYIDAILEEQ